MNTQSLAEVVNPGRLYTLPEAADILRVTPHAIRTWIADGRLPSYQAGNRYRFVGSDLLAFLCSGTASRVS